MKQNRDKPARIPLVHAHLASFSTISSFDHQEMRHPSIPHVLDQIWEAFRLPPLTIFRCLTNLRSLLVQVILTSTPHEVPGNYPCRASSCKTCPLLVSILDEFSSYMTGKSYKAKTRASCKSSDVIHSFTCRRWGQQYVCKQANRSTWG